MWSATEGKTVEIEGVSFEVSSPEDLVEKIKQRARELGMATFRVYNADGREMEQSDIEAEYDSITSLKLGKYDTPA